MPPAQAVSDFEGLRRLAPACKDAAGSYELPGGGEMPSTVAQKV